jgi:hypothetical protein
MSKQDILPVSSHIVDTRNEQMVCKLNMFSYESNGVRDPLCPSSYYWMSSVLD